MAWRVGFLRFLSLWLAGGAVVAAVVRPPPAMADHLQLNPTWCEPVFTGFDVQVDYSVGFANVGSQYAYFVCPIPSDTATTAGTDAGDNFDHRRTNAIYVHATDASASSLYGSVTAQACITWFDSPTGGSCGSTASSSGSGTGFPELSPGTAAWIDASTFPEDYPCLYLGVPAPAPAASGIRGYRVASD